MRDFSTKLLDSPDLAHATEALRESEARFRAAFEQAAVGMAHVGLDGRWLLVNQRLCDIVGYDRDELLTRTFQDITHADDLGPNLTNMRSLLAGEVPRYSMLKRYLRKDGSLVWVNLTAATVCDDAGRPLYFISVIEDVTARKQAEEGLRRAHDELEEHVRERTAELARVNEALREQAQLLDLAHDSIFVRDGNSVLTFWNRGAEERYGWSRAEAVGQSSHALLRTQFPQPLVEIEAELRDTGRWEGELVHTRRDGTRIVVASRWAVQRDEAGRTVKVLEINNDVTERRRAERALRDSEERFRLLIDAVRDYAVYMLDPGGRVASWNRGAEQLKGYRAAEIIGRHFSCFFPREEVRQGRPDRELAIATAEGRYQDEGWRLRKDGSRFWADVVITAVRDGEGRLRGFAKVTRDMTERRRGEERLRAFAAELERSNRELQDFAFVASHDLQEPLRKVQSFADLLAEEHGAALGAEGRDYLGRMTQAATRMRALINDLLALSRVTTRAKPFAPVDLGQVAREVVVDLEANLRAGGRVELGDLPSLEADPTQMRQLFQNLIGNALKFHRPGEPPVVEVRGETGPAGTCRITVRDNGIGFDEKHRERIFEMFQRLHGRGEYEGTGMGLAICRKIVERHGGAVTTASRPGQGATFVVTLPLRQPRTEERA